MAEWAGVRNLPAGTGSNPAMATVDVNPLLVFDGKNPLLLLDSIFRGFLRASKFCSFDSLLVR